MAFNTTFGGGPVNPSKASFLQVALSANTAFQWPDAFPSAANVIADLMYVMPTAAGFNLLMPPANGGSHQQTLFVNPSANSFTVTDAGGNTIAVIAAGQSKFVYLINNTTVNGQWGVFTFGTGTSGADASMLAGLGLMASGATLQLQHSVITTATGLTVSPSMRAQTIVWTGGAGTLALPVPSTLGNGFFTMVNNQGTSLLTVTSTGGNIDSASSIQLAQGESCIVICSGNDYYTVGRGRLLTFAFQSLVKDVSGSAGATLTAVEATKNLQQYNGVLTGNSNIIVPSNPQLYFVFNNTTGPFTLTMKTVAGTGVSIPQAAHVILQCDGTNVVNAYTSTGGGTYAFIDGSATAPSITFQTQQNSGLFKSPSNGVGVTALGTQVALFDAQASAVNYLQFLTTAAGTSPTITAMGTDADIGFRFVTKGAGALVSASTTGAASVDVQGLAASGRYSRYATGALLRWTAGANATAEAGSNAGSAYAINRYSDAGAFVDTPFIIARDTGAVGITTAAITSAAIATITNSTAFTASGTFASTGTSPVFGQTANTNTLLRVNGAASGAGGGSAFVFQLGGTSAGAFGNYSSIFGGTYDATPTIYSAGANLRFTSNGATQMTLDTSGNLTTVGSYSGTTITGSGLVQGSRFLPTTNSGEGLRQSTNSNTGSGFALQGNGAVLEVGSTAAAFTGQNGFDASFFLHKPGASTNVIQLYFGINSDYSSFIQRTGTTLAMGSFGGFNWQTANNTTPKMTLSGTGDLAMVGGMLSSSPTTGVGYATGAGGTVTQITSKTTAVTLNKTTGKITTTADALASNTAVQFTLNNSTIAVGDLIVVNPNTNTNAYRVWGAVAGAGVANIVLENRSASPLSEAVAISFAIIKGVTS